MPLLISADFFQMSTLTRECQNYFVEHIDELSNLPINAELCQSALKQITSMVSFDKLIELNHKNKIINSFLRIKLLNEIDNKNIYLNKCKHCN